MTQQKEGKEQVAQGNGGNGRASVLLGTGIGGLCTLLFGFLSESPELFPGWQDLESKGWGSRPD